MADQSGATVTIPPPQNWHPRDIVAPCHTASSLRLTATAPVRVITIVHSASSDICFPTRWTFSFCFLLHRVLFSLFHTLEQIIFLLYVHEIISYKTVHVRRTHIHYRRSHASLNACGSMEYLLFEDGLRIDRLFDLSTNSVWDGMSQSLNLNIFRGFPSVFL